MKHVFLLVFITSFRICLYGRIENKSNEDARKSKKKYLTDVDFLKTDYRK